MKFSIKGFFSKCDKICSFLRIRSHLLKKSLIEKFIFRELVVRNAKWSVVKTGLKSTEKPWTVILWGLNLPCNTQMCFDSLALKLGTNFLLFQ